MSVASIQTFPNQLCNATGTLRDEYVASYVDALYYAQTSKVPSSIVQVVKTFTVGTVVGPAAASTLVDIDSGTSVTIPSGAVIDRCDVHLGANGSLTSTVAFQLGYINTALSAIANGPSPPSPAVAAQATLASFITGSANSVKATVLNYNKDIRFFPRLTNAQITTATVGENAIFSNLVPAPSAPANGDYAVVTGIACCGEAQPLIPCILGVVGNVNPNDVYISLVWYI